MLADLSSAVELSTFQRSSYETSGTEQWARLYDGPAQIYDGTYAIAVDNEHNVLVTGYIRVLAPIMTIP